ncbi:hypothetical protein BGZ49_004677 [Haplosporangium sp. Z 27]|nr:hypothetical protein BGZ49_004677 [Haplosporangium sp. Z 27]
MTVVRLFQANRALCTALVTLAFLGLFLITLDKNRTTLQTVYANAKSFSRDNSISWNGSIVKTTDPNPRPLLEYPGRKPKTFQAMIEKLKGHYQRIVEQHHGLLDHYGSGKQDINDFNPLSDGGKWICGIGLYEQHPRPKCVLYSFGISHETRFEGGDILDRTNCEIFAYGASVTEMRPETQGPRSHFKPYFVGKEDKRDEKGIEWRTLRTLMKENGHDWIDILKIDIEGSEPPILDAIMNDFGDVLPFSQLQVEFHLKRNSVDFSRFLKLWERLESKGVFRWRTEINLIPTYSRQRPWVSEYCFINTRDSGKNDNLLIQN